MQRVEHDLTNEQQQQQLILYRDVVKLNCVLCGQSSAQGLAQRLCSVHAGWQRRRHTCPGREDLGPPGPGLLSRLTGRPIQSWVGSSLSQSLGLSGLSFGFLLLFKTFLSCRSCLCPKPLCGAGEGKKDDGEGHLRKYKCEAGINLVLIFDGQTLAPLVVWPAFRYPAHSRGDGAWWILVSRRV